MDYNTYTADLQCMQAKNNLAELLQGCFRQNPPYIDRQAGRRTFSISIDPDSIDIDFLKSKISEIKTAAQNYKELRKKEHKLIESSINELNQKTNLY